MADASVTTFRKEQRVSSSISRPWLGAGLLAVSWAGSSVAGAGPAVDGAHVRLAGIVVTANDTGERALSAPNLETQNHRAASTLDSTSAEASGGDEPPYELARLALALAGMVIVLRRARPHD